MTAGGKRISELGSSVVALLRDQKQLIILSIVVVFIWGLLGMQLRFHWGDESYYNYGWYVPWLGILLFYRRFLDAPDSTVDNIPLKGYYLLFLLCLIAIVPFRMLSEVNPFWRVPLWGQGFFVFLGSVLFFVIIGGVRFGLHFVWPCLFLLTMLPWPFQIETAIVQFLTQWTLNATLFALHFIGYPAVITGNVIYIGDAQVGVEEACSGIRSLQTLGMISILLGEFFRMKLSERFGLVFVHVLLVFVFNLIRASILTLIVIHLGDEGYAKWHDPVGNVTFIVNVLSVYAMSEMYHDPNAEPKAKKRTTPLVFRKISWAAVGIIAFFFVIPEISVAGWFNYREAQEEESVTWSMDWPEEKPGEFEFVSIPKSITDILHFDFGYRAQLQAGKGKGLNTELYYYGYTGENPISSVSSYGHAPTICMKAIGAELIEELEPLNLQLGPLTLPLRHYVFRASERHGAGIIQVFWCIWERRNMGVNPEELRSLDRMKQLELLWLGRRDYSRQVLLVSIPGEEGFGNARVMLSKTLSDLIKTKVE